jgi:hypothetical protein
MTRNKVADGRQDVSQPRKHALKRDKLTEGHEMKLVMPLTDQSTHIQQRRAVGHAPFRSVQTAHRRTDQHRNTHELGKRRHALRH